MGILVQHQASLNERSVQKIAKENVKMRKPRRAAKRPSSSRSKARCWTEELDPRIVKELKAMRIPRIWERLEIVSFTEVIIRNG